MRQIKFRAWDSKTNEMYYSCDSHTVWGGGLCGRVVSNTGSIEIPLSNLMQFTGLLDKNGKEIYEGDVLRLSDGGDVSHHRIYFDENSHRWMDERLEDGDSLTCYDEFNFVKDAKIIGNIYENPDLLK